MRLVPRSLRVRLVVVFAIGASVALTFGLVLLYLLLDRQLSGVLDADLARRSDDLAAAVVAGDADVVRADPLAQLYAADGSLLAGSPVMGDRPLLDAGQVRGVRGAELTTATLPLAPGATPAQVRLLSLRIADGRVLVVGVPAGAVQAARDQLLVVLLVAAPLLVGLVSTAGWLVVRAALRPVGALTREAATISTLDTDQRLPPVPGDDEIAELARTLDGMLARLEVAFARERAFVDDASHELRTPIAVLRGEIELALSAADDTEEVERSLRAALAETDRLSRLAEDLLLLARQQAGALAIQNEPVDLLDLATAHLHSLEPVLGLSIEVCGDPVVVEADASRLRQVLANLAANSAAAGAAVVQVQVTSDRDGVVLGVTDDGPGFPPDLLNSAFERFVRGDDARTRGRTGAGLGLSIVRAIVAAHGGTVRIGNGGPLDGAVVTIRLPAR
ncbi:two-component sensor histidine kinase [Pseudonocardia sp. CNS-004]|nr:two-component sensor histidine kinase [Pseudonocardia sp. CNS-004]